MDGTPRFEILISRNNNDEIFIAERDPNALPQSLHTVASAVLERFRRRRRVLTAGVMLAETAFLSLFLIIVKLFDLTDTQSVIVAISLAASAISLLVLYLPKHEKLILTLLRRLLRLPD